MAFSFPGGTSFSLLSFDLAEGGTNNPVPMTIQMIGYLHGGGALTNVFTTDGIIDGPGGLADFQTFYPDSGFTALDRIEIRSGGFSLDNVRLWVPEPSSASLVLLGGAWLLAWRRWSSTRPR